MRPWADIATLTHTRDLKGGLVAHAAPGLPFLLRQGLHLALVPPVLDMPRNVRVASVSPNGQREALVLFSEISTADQARQLVGCHCLARRCDLDVSVEGAVADALPAWQGWSAYDRNAGFIGTVERIEERPAQALIVIACEDGTSALVPLVSEFIVSIDEEAQRLDLACPEGLLDL